MNVMVSKIEPFKLLLVLIHLSEIALIRTYSSRSFRTVDSFFTMTNYLRDVSVKQLVMLINHPVALCSTQSMNSMYLTTSVH